MNGRLLATGLALLVGAVLWADGTLASPTPEARRAIQGMINRGNPQRAAYEKKRSDFLKAYRAWKKDTTEANRQAAIAQRDSMRAERAKVKANRDSVIAKVDSTYDTNEPAGTDVQYDPECTDYGYTSSRCFVRICEPSFGSPEDVATTKIHEFEHVRQKAAGRWGPGNVPQPCTFAFHQLEFEAYQAELNADFGKKTSLPIETKFDLLERKSNHLKGMLDDLAIKVGDDKVRRVLPGAPVETQVTVINDAELERSVVGAFTDQAGWTITPPGYSHILGPEQQVTFPIQVNLPPGVPLGTANEVFGSAAAVPDETLDFLFVHVIPVVDVTRGSNVSGEPGSWLDVLFTVTNAGAVANEFDVNVSSVLGWPLAQTHWVVPLDPGGSTDLLTQVQVPEGAEHATDLLLCSAFALADPAQADQDWLFAELVGGTTGVGEDRSLALALMPAMPNPLTRGALLRFTLPAAGPVDLAIYDVAGRRVRALARAGDGAVSPGAHAVRWDGTDDRGARVASGVYFARLSAGGRGVVGRVVVLE